MERIYLSKISHENKFCCHFRKVSYKTPENRMPHKNISGLARAKFGHDDSSGGDIDDVQTAFGSGNQTPL
jgi:hypothetical protein